MTSDAWSLISSSRIQQKSRLNKLEGPHITIALMGARESKPEFIKTPHAFRAQWGPPESYALGVAEAKFDSYVVMLLDTPCYRNTYQESETLSALLTWCLHYLSCWQTGLLQNI